MSLAPDINEMIARARSDLRLGLPVVLNGPHGAAIVAAAETLEIERLNEIRVLGASVLAITARRAETLKARCYDGDLARIELPQAASLSWIQSIADPTDDLNSPLKGPLNSARQGHSDLHRFAIQLAKSARLLPAMLVTQIDDARDIATMYSLTLLQTGPAEKLLAETSQLHPVVAARLPLAVSESGRLHIFRPEDGGEEHYAIEIGRPPRDKPVLTRLHSACFTGDVLGSLKCDCGPQLHAALAQMGKRGHGVLLYLNQEGRGIGLANKMRAYALQNQGFDTVQANHRLGFEDDERDFTIGVNILKSLGFSEIELMTNNPKKISMMEKNGIKVTKRVPLIVGENAHNSAYLATKAQKSGHLL